MISFDYVVWLIRGSGAFVAFHTSISKQLYCFFVAIVLLLRFKEYRSFYRRMKEVPFLIISGEGIHLDKKMLPFPPRIGGAGKVELKWSDIQSIQRKQNSLVISHREKGEGKSKKVDLRWVKEKEKLITILKDRCKDHDIERILEEDQSL